MNQTQLAERKEQYDGWTVLSANQEIHPCIGCFTCWKKTPGRCVFRDGFDQMAGLIDSADEIVYNSRFTYGGFSSFVKNVFDRSISYVLPYFEVSDNEMHHQRRYDEIKKITFVFRGHDLTGEEKSMAENYVYAVCRNMRNRVKEVLFEEENISRSIPRNETRPEKGKILLLNCSLRGKNANSEIFLTRMSASLQKEYGYFRLAEYQNRMDDLIHEILKSETIVLALPLYVDGLPSHVIRFLSKLEEAGNGDERRIYILANLGLYESHQLKNMLGMLKYFCKQAGYTYSGAAAIGAGELVGVLLAHMKKGPVKHVSDALSALGDHVQSGERMEDICAQPFLFPRWLYIQIANRSWDLSALSAHMKPSALREKPQYIE